MGAEGGSMIDMEKEKLAPFFRPILTELLETLSFRNSPEATNPPEPWDVELTKKIMKIVDPSLAQDALPPHAILYLVRFGIMVCRKSSPEAQQACAHYTVLVTIIDDIASKEGEKFMKDMELFQVKMCSPDEYSRLFPDRGPLHPVLENLITFLTTDLCPLFLKHPILHNILIKCSLDFIIACQLEQHHSGRLGGSKLELSTDIQQYPAFLRVKSGLGESYSLFSLYPLADDEAHIFYNKIFPVMADLNDFWVNINDMLSLYKEIKEGDPNNFVLHDAKLNSITLHDAIKKLFENAVECHKRVMSVVDSTGSLSFKDYVIEMYQGFISWHLAFVDRYHLDEVLSEWYAGYYWP